MAAHPIVVVDHGKVEIPQELQDDPRFKDGARLQLVPVQPVASTDATARKGDWHRLEGILADSEFDSTEWKRQERERELTHDEQKFGKTRPAW
jgi:hypothetical protein